jgi:ABC-type nitrate/sulfonate/bicarbonate transport system substrate-binding protein
LIISIAFKKNNKLHGLRNWKENNWYAMTRSGRVSFYLLFALWLLSTPIASATDTVTIGLVGTTGPTHWPIHIGLKNGYFDAENIKLDLIFAQSSGAVVQQLAAGSLDAALSAGLVDPIYAIDRGAPIAIVRLEMQLSPYSLISNKNYAKIEELKGKTLMVDGPKGITKIYVERMLAAHNIQPSEVDFVFVGATAARFSALQAGAIDATILLPPFSFAAEAAGFRSLGLTADYAGDLPFTGAAVNKTWAEKNPALMLRLLSAHNRSVAWFLDRTNRQAAIELMVEASRLKPDIVAQTYDFLHQRDFIEGTGAVSKSKMRAMLTALKGLGDLQGSTDVERFLLPGVARISD